MIKTYIWTGREATRALLKKGQSKVTVEPNETVTSEIDLSKSSRFFVKVGADSVANLKDRLGSIADRKKLIKSNLKSQIEILEEKLEKDIEALEAKANEDIEKIDAEEKILKGQLDVAMESINNKKAELEAQIKELEKEKKDIEKEEKKAPKKEEKEEVVEEVVEETTVDGVEEEVTEEEVTEEVKEEVVEEKKAPKGKKGK